MTKVIDNQECTKGCQSTLKEECKPGRDMTRIFRGEPWYVLGLPRCPNRPIAENSMSSSTYCRERADALGFLKLRCLAVQLSLAEELKLTIALSTESNTSQEEDVHRRQEKEHERSVVGACVCSIGHEKWSSLMIRGSPERDQWDNDQAQQGVWLCDHQAEDRKGEGAHDQFKGMFVEEACEELWQAKESNERQGSIAKKQGLQSVLLGKSHGSGGNDLAASNVLVESRAEKMQEKQDMIALVLSTTLLREGLPQCRTVYGT